MSKIENCLISIIVPIYNSQTSLDKCISSLINQTYKNLEIILVDDGSTDDSLKICRNYEKIDYRIKTISKINQGVSSARNLGIYSSNGEYIMFVDSDDYLEINTIKELSEVLYLDSKYDLIIFGINKIHNNKKNSNIVQEVIRKYDSKEKICNVLPELIINETINSPVNKLYKADIIKSNDIKFDINLNIAEDLMFNTIYTTYITSLYITNKLFYNYNEVEESTLSKKYNKYKYDQLMEVNNNMQYELSILDNKLNIQNAINYIRVKNMTSCFLDIHYKMYGVSLIKKLDYIDKILNNERYNIYYKQKLFKINHINILGFIYKYSNKYIIYFISFIICKITNRRKGNLTPRISQECY